MGNSLPLPLPLSMLLAPAGGNFSPFRSLMKAAAADAPAAATTAVAA